MAGLAGMLNRVALLLLAVLTGCHVRAGVDAASHINGPLRTLMSQSTVTRGSEVTNLPTANGDNYSLEAGFGNQTITVNTVLAVHDVSSTTFTPGAGYIASTLGADVRWSILHWKGLSPSLAAGPARMMLLDRTSGERTWGNGVRAVAGLSYQLGPVALYGDVYHEHVVFSGGAAEGTTKLDGVTFGLALQP